MLLAIDPGSTSGWALFETEGQLHSCGLKCQPPARVPGKLYPWLPAIRPDLVIIERPRIYPGGRTKNPNDVLSVAIDAGEWGGRYKQLGCAVDYVEPAGWKGQTPKDVQHARDWAKLTEAERDIVNRAGKGMAASKRHNMLDAVGIGLWALKR